MYSFLNDSSFLNNNNISSLAFIISSMRFYFELISIYNQITCPTETSVIASFTNYGETQRPFVNRGSICENIMEVKNLTPSLTKLPYDSTFSRFMLDSMTDNKRDQYKFIRFSSFRSLVWSVLMQSLSERTDLTSEQTVRELCILAWMGMKFLHT